MKLRWAERSDMGDIAFIERCSFEYPTPQDELTKWAKGKDTFVMVITQGEVIAGFIMFDVFDKRVDIFNLAVLPDCRRQGVGRSLVEYSKGSRVVTAEIGERNLAGQQFFASQGFEYVRTTNTYRINGYDQDCYLFEWSPKVGAKA